MNFNWNISFSIILDYGLTILVFALILSFLIFIHELGHFLAARWSGVTVEKFAIGLGKKIWSKTKNGTEFSIRAIPFGGFVQMLGEEEKSENKGSFGAAKLWKRMSITLAGIFMNYVFAILCLGFIFWVGTTPIIVNQADFDQAIEKGIVQVTINEKNERTVSHIEKIKLPFFQAMQKGFTETIRLTKKTLEALENIPKEISEKKELKSVSGPIGIAKVIHSAIPGGIVPLLKIMALISLSLGFMNLLPIPALDGGRFLFQIIELILMPFGLKINQKIENIIHMTGFILLIGLMLLVTGNDFWNIFTK